MAYFCGTRGRERRREREARQSKLTKPELLQVRSQWFEIRTAQRCVSCLRLGLPHWNTQLFLHPRPACTPGHLSCKPTAVSQPLLEVLPYSRLPPPPSR